MIAVSEVDRIGGAILVAVAALYFLGAGIAESLRARSRPPHAAAGNSVTAESTDREEVAGRSSRVPSAAMAIEALTFPGPYSQIGSRR